MAQEGRERQKPGHRIEAGPIPTGERADGKWAAFETALIVPRQNGKGSILEARELAGLFLFGEQLILHSAHEFKTAQEAFRRVLAYRMGMARAQAACTQG